MPICRQTVRENVRRPINIIQTYNRTPISNGAYFRSILISVFSSHYGSWASQVLFSMRKWLVGFFILAAASPNCFAALWVEN